MPIIERTPRECFDKFRGHLSELFAKALSKTAVLRVELATPTLASITLRQGQSLLVPLSKSDYGRLYFTFAQLVEAQDEGNKYRLATLKYWYRVQETNDENGQALIRWEYERTLPAPKRHCRHHVQIGAEIESLGTAVFDLDKLHIPTGWVTIEEVLRFLINDLDHRPPAVTAWPAALEDSERTFFEDFTSRRYHST